jgi:predicted nucleic acid-binding protein
MGLPVISTLSEVELYSLVSKKQRIEQLTARRAQEVRDLFETHLAEGYYRRLSLHGEHSVRARQLVSVSAYSLRTLDALHFAVAISESLPIMTADRGLARAARREKSPVILLKAA